MLTTSEAGTAVTAASEQDGAGDGDEDEEGEPAVELTSWSTKGLVVPGGSTTTVPIMIPDVACVVEYSFSASSPDTLSSAAYLHFRISSAAHSDRPLVDVTRQGGEGRVDVEAGTGVLLAVLDNEGGWSAVSVAVQMGIKTQEQATCCDLLIACCGMHTHVNTFTCTYGTT